MNAAIITARGGSCSLSNKNLWPILGEAILSRIIRTAQAADLVSAVYVDTDGKEIAKCASRWGSQILDRPEYLAEGTGNHGEVIQKAVRVVNARQRGHLENVVILLGNSCMYGPELIDEALATLQARPDLTGVMSVWQAADDHPLRAMEMDQEGILLPWRDPHRDVPNNRQAYLPAFFYDQGVWAFRKECVEKHDGPSPWWWMGNKVGAIVRPWIGGRDIHNLLDVAVTEWWVGRNIRRLRSGQAPGDRGSGPTDPG